MNARKSIATLALVAMSACHPLPPRAHPSVSARGVVIDAGRRESERASDDASIDARAIAESAEPRAAPQEASIAAQIIAEFDQSTQRARVRTERVPGQREPQQLVRSLRGDVALVADSTEPGAITVTTTPGSGWADGLLLARVVAGYYLGRCGHDHGWVALFDPRVDRVLAYRPISGQGCAQEQEHQFLVVAGERLLLATHRASGEDGPSVVHTSIWRFADGQLHAAGSVRSGQSPGASGPRERTEAAFVVRDDALVMQQTVTRDERVLRRREVTLRFHDGQFAR